MIFSYVKVYKKLRNVRESISPAVNKIRQIVFQVQPPCQNVHVISNSNMVNQIFALQTVIINTNNSCLNLNKLVRYYNKL